MKAFLVLISLLFSLQVYSQIASEYKGYKTLDKKIFAEILIPTNKVSELGVFIDEFFSPFSSSGFLNLMGYYRLDISNGKIINGVPNNVSYLVHYLVFYNLTRKISYDCLISEDPSLQKVYQESFLKVFIDICGLPATEAISEKNYFSLWLHIHSFEAPEEEFLAWYNYNNEQVFSNRRERMDSLMLSALLNPYFFIQN